MISLDYRLDPSWNARLASTNLGELDEVALSYTHFLGDVLFRVDSVDFDAAWGWVPVIDFATGLLRIVDGLSPGVAECFEFTESEARLCFLRNEDKVTISATYALDPVTVPWAELQKATQQFARRVLGEIGLAYPGIHGSPAFSKLQREVSREVH